MKNFPLLTKVLATLGPSCADSAIVERMIEAGVRCFRINFSHGSEADWRRMLDEARRASSALGIPVGVLGDLPGPKIRIGRLPPGGVFLQAGQQVEFSGSEVSAGGYEAAPGDIVLPTTYARLAEDVEPGAAVLLDDGAIRLRCQGQRRVGDEERLVCEVMTGGLVTTAKGLNLPDSDLSLPSLTERDKDCVLFAIDNGFDFLALSFVRSADDVRSLREFLAKILPPQEGLAARPPVPIISKIEKPQALAELEAIVAVSDGLIVARGDLGVEMDLAEVPVAQKRIVELGQETGKPVIVATQMLQSMIDAPTPTRAEVSDVANAVFDGVDGVLLSGETAVGRWPVESVRMMARIARRANAFVAQRTRRSGGYRPSGELRAEMEALAQGVASMVNELEVRLVVLWAQEASAVRSLSQRRLKRPVVAFSSNPRALQQMSIYYGVVPLLAEDSEGADAFIGQAERALRERQWAVAEDLLLCLLTEPAGASTQVNTIRLHRLAPD